MATDFVPDGYYDHFGSDDELEAFDANEEWNTNDVERAPVRYEPNPREIYQRKIDDFYSNLAAGNFESVADALTDIDVNVDLRDDWTPLLLATSIGNHSITQLLLEKGADVHRHRDYLTPLMAACKCPVTTASFKKSSACVKLLTEYGINVNAINRKRITALMYAASSGNHLSVEILLPICNVHAVDNQGWHALFWAVSDKRINIVQQLIAAGLNIEQVDVRRQSLTEFAISTGIDEIILAIAPDTYNNNVSVNYSAKTYSNFKEECTVLNEITKKPNFYREVSLFLHGSRSEQYLPQFMDNNIDLYSFLSMTDYRLQEIGISTPFQRYRFLKGLYMFHKKPYKSKSIPILKAETEATTLDISKIVIAFIRQIIAMEASLQYLMDQDISAFSNEESTEIKSMAMNIVEIRNKLKILKQYCWELELLAGKWDKFNAPVDAINKQSVENVKRFSKWYKFRIPIGCVFLIGSYFYIRKRI